MNSEQHNWKSRKCLEGFRRQKVVKGDKGHVTEEIVDCGDTERCTSCLSCIYNDSNNKNNNVMPALLFNVAVGQKYLDLTFDI